MEEPLECRHCFKQGGAKQRRFVLQAGKGVKVEESRRKDMESILEMRSDIFKGPNDQHSFKYDLDGDGRADVNIGKFWKRWGRIF